MCFVVRFYIPFFKKYIIIIIISMVIGGDELILTCNENGFTASLIGPNLRAEKKAVPIY